MLGFNWKCSGQRSFAQGFLRLLVVAGAALLYLTCDEVLPPRGEPAQFLDLTMDVFPKDYVIINGRKWQNLEFTLSLRNMHDEVLQDTADIRGTVDIWLQSDPSIRATVTGDVHQLVGGISPYGSLLTLRPDSTVVVKLSWNHFTSQNTLAWWYVNGKAMTDAAGHSYYQSDPVFFVARASLQVFKNVQAVSAGPMAFKTTYWVYSTGADSSFHIILFPIENLRGVALPSNRVRLNWETSYEVRNYGFYVQRKLSSDTSSFVTVPYGFVPGYGTTNIFRKYKFFDTVPASGMWSYRLQQIADLQKGYHPVADTIGPIDVLVP